MRDKIPKSLFVRVRSGEVEEKWAPVSRKDKIITAFSVFFGRASLVIAAILILFVLLFSLLSPLLITRSESHMDPYYAKMPPRVSLRSGALGGKVSRSLAERGVIKLAAIGIGALDIDGDGVANFGLGDDYMPLRSIEDAGERYLAEIDRYLEVGFIYKTVTEEEYNKMLAWQSENELPLIYPLIADNEYNSAAGDANVWYKTNSRGEAVRTEEGEDIVLKFDTDILLEENYMKNSDGEVMYRAYSGGGTFETAGVRVRLLYYNYYKYQNGMAPDYIMGTDSQGYDLALRMAAGIRLSLLLAIGVSILNFVIGTLVGAIEGYFGGAVDLVLERVTDILSGVPFVVVATLFQIHLAERAGAIPTLLFAFVLTGWLGTANRVRAQFYRFKDREYVMAARTLGASHIRIMWRHIFPSTLGTIITASALVIPGVIFTESMLSFLGIVNLGGESATSLGTLLAEAGGTWVNFPHLMLYPAAAVSILMIAFNLLGNGLRDLLGKGSA